VLRSNYEVLEQEANKEHVEFKEDKLYIESLRANLAELQQKL
jgi:hypothetical protein